jgi:DNA-binding response OmpR family regulator
MVAAWGEARLIKYLDGVFLNIGTPHALTYLMKRNMNSNAPAAQTDQPMILVADDDADTRQVLTSTLSSSGCSCATATSVGEAITALNNDRFKLMILDWGLDRCESEVIRVAKRLSPQMPVLVMSGPPFDVRTDAVMEEAEAFLPKSFSCIVLSKQATQLMNRDTFLPSWPEDIMPLEDVKRVYIRHVVALPNDDAALAAEKLQIHRQTVATALQQTDADADDPPGSKRTN